MGNGKKFDRKRSIVKDYGRVLRLPESPLLDVARSVADESITRGLSSSAAGDFRKSLLHRELGIEARRLSGEAMSNLARGKGIPTAERYVVDITRGAASAHMKASLGRGAAGALKTGINIGLKSGSFENPSLIPTINLVGHVMSDVIKGPYTWDRWWWEYGRHSLRSASGFVGPIKLSGRPLINRIEDLAGPREVRRSRPVFRLEEAGWGLEAHRSLPAKDLQLPQVSQRSRPFENQCHPLKDAPYLAGRTQTPAYSVSPALVAQCRATIAQRARPFENQCHPLKGAPYLAELPQTPAYSVSPALAAQCRATIAQRARPFENQCHPLKDAPYLKPLPFTPAHR